MVNGFDGIPKLIHSDLCHEIVKSGRLLEVRIYRLEDRSTWRLEVVNEQGTSTLWNRSFPTDLEALHAFRRKLSSDGPIVFLDTDDATSLGAHRPG